ncbi:MAG TPA: 2-oxoacid:acceptor oxidoreductase subunit alpha, partial [Polyangia bacterium]|nr:2-oxoacid:acceptor oxidoreductase subunit alpha [Polyangia bacterium]
PDFDLMVALNPATYKKDVAEVRSGGWLMYDSTWPLAPELKRADVTILGIPLAQMVNSAFAGGRERILMKNIAYAGALAALLDMDTEIIATLIKETYGKKAALLASNEKALALGFDYAKKNFACPLPIKMAKLAGAHNQTDGHILINGNTAAALGALYAGATVGAWYPITPATSLMEAFTGFCRQFRENPDGTKRYAILQAEDELSAIGMVIGASWMGARSFTPTSGPGISLMSEFIGLAYYAEIPAVVFDVQRTGPSTGMPTRTQQGDVMLCAYASHGDTKHICLYPANPEECFTMAVEAFDLADRFQTPVFVLSDLDIGMNDWMCTELTWDDAYRPDRGKVLDAAALDQMQQKAQNFYRYLDSDGDGIPYRTLPGTHPKGAFFTRGSGHNKLGGYTEDPTEYMEVVDRVARKIESACEKVPQPIIINGGASSHKLGLITIGSNDGACRESLEELARRGVELDFLRVRGFPFSQKIHDFIDAHERVFVVESNRDAQLMTMLQVELELSPEKLLSLRYYGGFPLSAGFITAGVTAYLQPAQKRAVGEAKA